MHEYTWGAGKRQRIADLLKQGSHKVEAWGNSREGFEAYLVAGNAGISISDRYRRLCDLRRDAKDQFGPLTVVAIGRNF